MIPLPKKLKAPPHTYKVVLVEDGILEDAGRYGHASLDRLVMAITDGLPLTQEQNTVIHETCHIILGHLDLPEEIEERVCLAMGDGLLSVMQMNPSWVEYVCQKS